MELIIDEKRNEWDKSLVIAVDFDNTLTIDNKFPEIGDENPRAFDFLKKLQTEGIKIILHTMRGGECLQKAIEWCSERDFVFDGIGKHPYQDVILDSIVPKCFAHFYIDDRNVGTPLKQLNNSLCVDWEKIEELWGEFFVELNNRKK